MDANQAQGNPNLPRCYGKNLRCYAMGPEPSQRPSPSPDAFLASRFPSSIRLFPDAINGCGWSSRAANPTPRFLEPLLPRAKNKVEAIIRRPSKSVAATSKTIQGTSLKRS